LRNELVDTRHERREEFLWRAREAEALSKECDHPMAKKLCIYMAKSWRRMASEISDTECFELRRDALRHELPAKVRE